MLFISTWIQHIKRIVRCMRVYSLYIWLFLIVIISKIVQFVLLGNAWFQFGWMEKNANAFHWQNSNECSTFCWSSMNLIKKNRSHQPSRPYHSQVELIECYWFVLDRFNKTMRGMSRWIITCTCHSCACNFYAQHRHIAAVQYRLGSHVQPF